MTDVTYISRLSGNSGCHVWLCKSENNQSIFVRKISSNTAYNLRLNNQRRKQMEAQGFLLKNSNTFSIPVSSPKILGSGYINDCYYFDMEYISGDSLLSSLCTAEITKIKETINNICLLFSLESKSVKDSQDVNIIFHKKIDNLKKNLPNKYHDVLNNLLKVDYSGLSNGFCLGDLTLENIMISNDGGLVFIDLLDSFYDHWLIDYSKLKYDLLSGWSSRNIKLDQNAHLRHKICCELLDLYLKRKPKRIRQLETPLLLIQALRIIPYCQDAGSINLIDHFLNAHY